MVAQWRLTSHVAISVALRLLQGNRLKRRVCAKQGVHQDIVLGWNDADFKANFHVSRTNFAYLVNELLPVLQRQQLLRSTSEQLHPTARPKGPPPLRQSMSVRATPFLTRS